jgi:hypothetical protein
MRKVPFLSILGLLIAGPLTAQATTSKTKIDYGPVFWYFENPCTPDDWVELEWYAKGTETRTVNSQGSHYVMTVQYSGEGVGSETGLVFTLHNPAQSHRFTNFDNQIVYRHKDQLRLVGKGDKGVEQVIEWTYTFYVLHVLPDGTVHADYGGFGDPVCKMKK